MKQVHPYIPAVLATLFFTVFLCCCSMPQQQSLATDKQTYIDANLQFSISYPQSWAPFMEQARQGLLEKNSVLWEVFKKGFNNDLSLQVISILSTEFILEAQPADILFDIYPNLTLVSRVNTTMRDTRAEKLDGYTPHKTVRAWILRSSLRDYLLIFSAPPEYFAEQSDLFDEIANSFEILP